MSHIFISQKAAKSVQSIMIIKKNNDNDTKLDLYSAHIL